MLLIVLVLLVLEHVSTYYESIYEFIFDSIYFICSGLYCDGDVGAAVATGDGEEVRFTALFVMLPSL